LSARRSITNAHHPPEAYVAGASHGAKNRGYSLPKLNRSYVLALLGLAFAVVLCGMGLKLAFYLHYGSPSDRASLTRLWLEPRNNAVSAVHRIGGRNRFISNSQPLISAVHRVRRIDSHRAGAPPADEYRPAKFRFLVPFRSPPSPRFSLA
jgi:hypothetical protein